MLSIPPNPRITFKIRHEDPDVLVIDKPPGIVTQPGKGHEKDTLLNGLFAAYGQELQNLGASRDFGLLHRLDKQTSGLLVVARRPRAYDALRKAFAARRIRKFYWAVVKSAPKRLSGVIRRPISEATDEKKTARISSAGKPAITAYRVLDTSTIGALVECRPVTGRLHQVRVHMESIGSPILGDTLYAPKGVAAAARRLALHAHRIAFTHPVSGEKIDIRSPCPKDMRDLLKRLRLKRPEEIEAAAAAGSGSDGGHEVAGDVVGEEEAGVGEAPETG